MDRLLSTWIVCFDPFQDCLLSILLYLNLYQRISVDSENIIDSEKCQLTVKHTIDSENCINNIFHCRLTFFTVNDIFHCQVDCEKLTVKIVLAENESFHQSTIIKSTYV